MRSGPVGAAPLRRQILPPAALRARLYGGPSPGFGLSPNPVRRPEPPLFAPRLAAGARSASLLCLSPHAAAEHAAHWLCVPAFQRVCEAAHRSGSRAGMASFSWQSKALAPSPSPPRSAAAPNFGFASPPFDGFANELGCYWQPIGHGDCRTGAAGRDTLIQPFRPA